jgi:hypothetical protein
MNLNFKQLVDRSRPASVWPRVLVLIGSGEHFLTWFKLFFFSFSRFSVSCARLYARLLDILNSHLVFSSHFAKQDAVDSSRAIKLFRLKFLAIEGLRSCGLFGSSIVRNCAIGADTYNNSGPDSGENSE